MDNEIISIEDAALYLARQHRDRLTDEGLNKRFHELVHVPWSDEDTEKYFSVGPVQRPSPAYDKQTQQEKTETRREALFGLSVRVFRAELLACMEKGFLVPINPATDHHAPEFGALGLAAMVRFGDIEPAFYSSGGKVSKGGNQQPASEQSVKAEEISAKTERAATTEAAEEQTEEIRKREALIKELERAWKSIERDLRDASRTELKHARVTEKHGYWYVERAKKWARENGKLQSTNCVSSYPPGSIVGQLAAVTTVHRI